MMFDFQLAIIVDGALEERAFYISARSFAIAVRDSLALMMRDKPNAQFNRLTWFHPPL